MTDTKSRAPEEVELGTDKLEQFSKNTDREVRGHEGAADGKGAAMAMTPTTEPRRSATVFAIG